MDGGLDSQSQWRSPRKSCFLPARMVMALFRGKYVDYLGQALAAGRLRLPPDASPQRMRNLLNKLGRKKWNVHLWRHYAHGEGIAKYLARYGRGGPLKNTQIQAVSATPVTYRYYAHTDSPDGRKATELTLTHAEFIGRYLQHIPEPGRQGVRAYGLYAPTQGERLTQARAQHGQPPVERPVFLDWQSYLIRLTGRVEATGCAVCGQLLRPGRLIPRRQHDPPPGRRAGAGS